MLLVCMNETMKATNTSAIGLMPWVMCTLAAVFYAYEYLLRITPNVMAPELMRVFSVSAAQLGTLSAFYHYAYSPMQIPVGMLMDYWGPRRAMTIAVVLCVLGSLLFGYTEVLWVAQLGRLLMGFGSAFAFVGVLKLASIWLPSDRMAFISGLTTTLGFLGAGFGNEIMSSMVQNVGWQNTVFASGFFGILLVPSMWFIVRDGRNNSHNLNARGLLSEVYNVLRNRQILLNGLIGGLIMLPTTVFGELWGSMYLSAVHGFSTDESVRAVTMIFLGWAFGAPVMGAISDKIRRRRSPITIGSIFAAVFLVAAMYMPGLTPTSAAILLFGFGFFSSAEIICFAIGRENCADHLAASAIATTNFLVTLGAIIFQPLVGFLLDMGWSGNFVDGVRVYDIETYRMAYLLLPISVIIASVLTIALRETRGRSQVQA